MNYRMILALLAAIAIAGCATSAKTEFVDADGTSFKAVAKAGPFGTLDTTNQHLGYKWGETEGTIQVGNEAQGLDNSGQIEAAQIAGKLTADIVSGLLTSGLLNPAGDGNSGAGGGPIGNAIDRLNQVCEILCRLPAGIVNGSPILRDARQTCGCE